MRYVCALIVALFATSLHAQPPGPVVFGELMWMGSTASSADEWIELYNRTDAAVDIAGWTITRASDDGESVMLQIDSGAVAPGAVFLIANYAAEDERSCLAVAPDLVDAAVSLPNTKLQLRLYDGDPEAGAGLIDVADDGKGAPLAGDGALKRSMVRTAPDQSGSATSSWATAEDAAGWDPDAVELGTPGVPLGDVGTTGEGSPPTGTLIQGSSWAMVKGTSR